MAWCPHSHTALLVTRQRPCEENDIHQEGTPHGVSSPHYEAGPSAGPASTSPLCISNSRGLWWAPSTEDCSRQFCTQMATLVNTQLLCFPAGLHGWGRPPSLTPQGTTLNVQSTQKTSGRTGLEEASSRKSCPETSLHRSRQLTGGNHRAIQQEEK